MSRPLSFLFARFGRPSVNPSHRIDGPGVRQGRRGIRLPTLNVAPNLPGEATIPANVDDCLRVDPA